MVDISLDEVAWRKRHKYLTLAGGHDQGYVVWGSEGNGQAAADEFFDVLLPAARQATRGSRTLPVGARAGDHGPVRPVPAGESIPSARLDLGLEIDPQLLARASRLRAVSTDMSGGYAKSVRRNAPHATIVIDNLPRRGGALPAANPTDIGWGRTVRESQGCTSGSSRPAGQCPVKGPRRVSA